ncbi:MAG: TonB-dependent receptor [Candidatus Omnitrophota bacterium]
MTKVASYQIVFSLVMILSFFSLRIAAQEIEIEELELIYGEDIIVTAAKREQKIVEAPSAISVITSEDIKQLGATQLGEAFIMTPGVHIGYTAANYMIAGGIRGFEKLPGNKTLLLIDGVLWQWDMYNRPAYYPLPIALEEIERIEVLRGPGSSLYGANAMLGLVNIITKKLKDIPGTLVSLTVGEDNTIVGNYLHGSSIENKIDYRLSLGLDYRDNFSGSIAYLDNPVGKYPRTNASVDYIIDDNSKVNLVGSYMDLRECYGFSESTGAIDYADSDYYFTAVSYTSRDPNIISRVFWSFKDHWDSGNSKGVARNAASQMKLQGAEFQHSFEPFGNDIFVWGANVSQVKVLSVLCGKRRHDMSGVYADNVYKLTDNFSIDTGLRFDFHPNTGDTNSHRLAFLYSPNEKHHFRFTSSSAFRNPDFVESYVSYVIPGTYILTGYETLEPEKAETLEIGYRGWVEKLSIETNLFYTKVADYIAKRTIFLGPPQIIDYVNAENLMQYGAEIELKYPVTDWLSGVFNYTYYKMWEDDVSDRDFLLMTPEHMFNAQLRAQFANRISANVSLHYRGSTNWLEYAWYNSANPPLQGRTIGGGKADDYLIVNVRLGYKLRLLNNNAEVALSVWNLFDNKYDDYPIDTADITRRITANFTYTF